jgi:hypothetical protein
VARVEGGEALGVEAGDEVRDGGAGAPPDGDGSLLVAVAPGHGQEHGGACDTGGGLGLRTTDLAEGEGLLGGERPERVVLAARHRWASWDQRLSMLRPTDHNRYGQGK